MYNDQEYTYFHIPSLQACEVLRNVSFTKVEIQLKSSSLESIEVEVSEVISLSSLFTETADLKSYKDFAKLRVLELFKHYLVEEEIGTCHPFNFYRKTSKDISVIYNVLSYLCSNAGQEILSLLRTKETSFYLKFHSLNQRKIGTNDSMKLIETLSDHESYYELSDLEMAETMFEWFDTDLGKEFLNKIVAIQAEEYRLHSLAIKLKEIKDSLEHVTFQGYYEHNRIKEVTHLMKEFVQGLE